MIIKVLPPPAKSKAPRQTRYVVIPRRSGVDPGKLIQVLKASGFPVAEMKRGRRSSSSRKTDLLVRVLPPEGSPRSRPDDRLDRIIRKQRTRDDVDVRFVRPE